MFYWAKVDPKLFAIACCTVTEHINSQKEVFLGLIFLFFEIDGQQWSIGNILY